MFRFWLVLGVLPEDTPEDTLQQIGHNIKLIETAAHIKGWYVVALE